MMALQERSSSPVPHPYPSSQAKGKRGHDDDDLLQSLQKRVDESGDLLKGLAQHQPVAANVAYANYMRVSNQIPEGKVRHQQNSECAFG